MRFIHWLLGSLILFFNWVFTPRSITRDAESQKRIDQESNNLALYHYKACPFCVKVRRTMKRQALNIETRDAKRSDQAKTELLEGGGKLKVPCLKIEEQNGDVRWMYESSDIINYLEQRFRVA